MAPTAGVSPRRPQAIVVLQLLLAVSLFRLADAFCPNVCVCDADNSRASCENAGLEVVPFHLNPEAKTIVLKGNQISTLEYSLTLYANLQSLDISMNQIKSLGSKNFKLLEKLTHLNVSGNEVHVIADDALVGLRSLRVVDLSQNLITSLTGGVFYEMHDLWELYLSGNRIESIEAGVFSSLVNLRVLKLSNNYLLDIPSDAISRLTSLRILTLNDNYIDSVNENALLPLQELTELSLANNLISKIKTTAFEGLASLDQLDLSENNITAVPTAPLSRLRRLTELDLSGNLFTHVGPVAFHSLNELRTIRLCSLPKLIRIDARAFSDNKRLESVLLENNLALTALPTRLFHGNPLVSLVSVRSSAITTLDAAHFPLDRLQVLDVTDVPLTCNCSLLWLWLLCHEQQEHLATVNQTAVEVTPSEVEPAVAPLASPQMMQPVVHVYGVRCMSPIKFKGMALVDVPEKEVRCEATWMAVLMVTAVVLSLFGATCTVLFFLSTGRWCGHHKEAPDVSVEALSSPQPRLTKHHMTLPTSATLLPGGQLMMMPPDMKVEPTYATIGEANGRSPFLADYKDGIGNPYHRTLNSWDTHSMPRHNHDPVRHNRHNAPSSYQNHYSMAIDMSKKPPHIVYV